MDINNNIQYMKGVGEAKARLLKKLGINTVADLLYFYPKRYEDWSKITPIKDILPDNIYCIKAKLIVSPTLTKKSAGKVVVKTIASDTTGLLSIVFFNNRYIEKQLKESEEYLFYGKISLDKFGEKCMQSPKFAPANKGFEQKRPIYKQTNGLSSKIIEKLTKSALDETKNTLTETLPAYITEKYNLPSLYDSIYQMHFPTDAENYKKAKNRLIFEELLALQTGLGTIRTRGKTYTAVYIKNDFSVEFENNIPFPLTNAQKRCIKECITDMQSQTPMNRLIQGDVGSGKTAVAASLIYTTVKNGWQCVLMAPTEILAEQHEKTLRGFFGDSVSIALLTGKTKQKKKLRESILNGEIQLVIGTHAVIQDNVIFNNLGLVITDEQHRFGVKQRSKLTSKGRNPHTLVMSATPIPRTLGLIIYGELDISVIDEYPKGRQKIDTYFVNSSYRQRIYKFIRKHIDEGRQVYIICPLVEGSENEENDLSSAEGYYERLKTEIFPDLRVGLIHGKMKADEKDFAMSEFSQGNIDILVATVVIEVGIDVPNASLMVVENAERFGLSQLHQLRGRIGRGEHKSTCILISDAQNEESTERLKIICKTTDGFKIADEDLKLRGPGDFLGERQHGLPELKIADIATDTNILYTAKKQAESIILADPDLSLPEHQCLKKQIKKMFADLGNSGLN